MPPRGLYQFILANNLLHTASIEELKGQRLGIEGFHFLRIATPQEPLNVATGGQPQALLAGVKNRLNMYEDAHIKPVLVFPGLDVARESRQEKLPAEVQMMYQKRLSAWQQYYKGDADDLTVLFKNTEISSFVSQLPRVFRHLMTHNVEFFRAPYLPWSQLAYFASPRCGALQVRYLQGSLDLLLYGGERVITELNFEERTFKYVALPEILHFLGCTQEMFTDICLVGGFDYLATIPTLTRGYSFKDAVDMVRNAMFSGVETVKKWSPEHLPDFMWAQALVHHLPVLECDARIALSRENAAPSQLHDVFGPRFPDLVYCLISLGALSVDIPNALVSGVRKEPLPIVLSEEFHDFVFTKLIDLFSTYFGRFTSCLVRQLHSLPLAFELCGDPENMSVPIKHSDYEDLFAVAQPRVNESELKLALKSLKKPGAAGGSSKKNPGMRFHSVAVVMASNDFASKFSLDGAVATVPATAADSSSSSSNAGPRSAAIKNELELSFYITFNAMVALNYIKVSHSPFALSATPWCHALALGSAEFSEEHLVLLELLRRGELHSDTFKIIPAVEYAAQDKRVELVARVFTVLQMKLAEKAWTGPLDLSLVCFNSLLRPLRHALRSLLEAEMAAMILKGRVSLRPQRWYPMISQLPAFEQSSTALGLVLKHMLLTWDEEGVGTHAKSVKGQDASDAISHAQRTFPECLEIREDLLRGHQMWQELVQMVKFLGENNEVDKSVVDMFTQADEFIKPRIPVKR